MRRYVNDTPTRGTVAIQRRRTSQSTASSVRQLATAAEMPLFLQNRGELSARIAAKGFTGSPGALPHLDRIQRAFGARHRLDRVTAYVGGAAAVATRDMGAQAYASNEQIAFGTSPNLRTAAHEATHVIQQRSGVVQPFLDHGENDTHERHADTIADRVVSGRPCGELLDACGDNRSGNTGAASAVQCLGQNLPYVGPLLSYLNLGNQALRAILPGLSPSQKTLLDGIFDNSLATSLIRLNPNSILAAGNCYRTTGNVINMPESSISDSQLIHEAAHVWQSQNTLFGVGYAISALRAQAIAQVLGGDWQRAYEYRNVERYRIPWRFWNAEQQANWIQDNRRLPNGWLLQSALPSFGVESSGLE